MSKTVFSRIIDRELPATIEHEDEQCIVIHDREPAAPLHLLIIPKRELPRLAEAKPADQALLGHLLLVAAEMARKNTLAQGFRIVINNGPHASESVPHLHVHLLGRRQMGWPPG